MKDTLFRGLQTPSEINFIVPQSKGTWLRFLKVYQMKPYERYFLVRKMKMVLSQQPPKRERSKCQV